MVTCGMDLICAPQAIEHSFESVIFKLSAFRRLCPFNPTQRMKWSDGKNRLFLCAFPCLIKLFVDSIR